MQIIEISISEEDLVYKRLDQFVTAKIDQLSRTEVKKLFENDLISSPSTTLELKKLPKIGTKITVQIPTPTQINAVPEKIDLDILYEDTDLLIVNKPAGMVTHPAPGNYSGTLVNAILYHCKELQKIDDNIRPGIVHRLDKGTSGVMVVAKNIECHKKLVLIFSKHEIVRRYEAITLNSNIPKIGQLQSYISRSKKDRKKMANFNSLGKLSKTNYQVLQYFEKFTHTELTLLTGRTHQIRVHLSGILNAPILMDPTYGNPKNHLRQLPAPLAAILKHYEHPMLHAKVLGFKHPISNQELFFEISPPQIFQETLKLLSDD